jgi:transcriptional regulator NrdR family protein
MNCPTCRGKTTVVNTRCTDSCASYHSEVPTGLVRRNRECADCNVRFKTEERIVAEFSREVI